MHTHVTFHSVEPGAYANVRERVLGELDGTEDAGGLLCRGVRAAVDYEEGDRQLHLRIDALPPLATKGQIVGWVHDALLAADQSKPPVQSPES
jgi:hypothetical protein